MMTQTAIETSIDLSTTYFSVKAGFSMERVVRDALDQAILTGIDVGIILPDGSSRLITQGGKLTEPMRQYVELTEPELQMRLIPEQRDSHLYLG